MDKRIRVGWELVQERADQREQLVVGGVEIGCKRLGEVAQELDEVRKRDRESVG